MAKKKITVAESKDSKENSPPPQPLPQKRTTRARSKNYSKDEIDLLIKSCQPYNGIINVQRNTVDDQKNKDNAWIKIKKDFDLNCQTEGILVCIRENIVWKLNASIYLFYNSFSIRWIGRLNN